jgi:hypothetical protein
MDHQPIIPAKTLETLNRMGYQGPWGGQPELVNLGGDLVAHLKKTGRFGLAAYQRQEGCHAYTVYDLSYYPNHSLNPRPEYAGPVPLLQIVTILEEDLAALPQFEARLLRAKEALLS